MEENLFNKKKTMLCISAAVLISPLLTILINIITASTAPTTIEEVHKYNLFSSCLTFAANIITAVVVFFASRFLTNKDTKKMLIFIGSIYFSSNVLNIPQKFIKGLGLILLNTTSFFYTGTYATTLSITLTVLLVPRIILAYYIFTALTGDNPKFPGQSINSCSMTLSQARKRFVITFLLCTVIGALFAAIPYSLPFFVNTDPLDGTFTTILNGIIEFISPLITLGITYLMGYKASGRHIEAITFSSAIACLSPIIAVVSSSLAVAINALNTFVPEGNYIVQSILAFVGSAVSIVVSIITFAATVVMFKHFFRPVVYSSETEYSTESL